MNVNEHVWATPARDVNYLLLFAVPDHNWVVLSAFLINVCLCHSGCCFTDTLSIFTAVETELEVKLAKCGTLHNPPDK